MTLHGLSDKQCLYAAACKENVRSSGVSNATLLLISIIV